MDAHKDDDQARAGRGYYRRIILSIGFFLVAPICFFIWHYGLTPRAMTALLLTVTIFGALFFLQEAVYRLRRVRMDMPEGIIARGGRLHIPALYIGDSLRVKRLEMLSVSWGVFLMVAGLFLYPLAEYFMDDDMLRAQGRRRTLADIDDEIWVIIAIGGLIVLGFAAMLRSAHRHARLLSELSSYAAAPESDENRGLVLSAEGVEIFSGILAEREREHYVRREGKMKFLLPWRDVTEWAIVYSKSSSRGGVYYYRIKSPAIDRRLEGAVHIDMAYFKPHRARLEEEAARHLGGPIKKSDGLRELARLFGGDDQAR